MDPSSCPHDPRMLLGAPIGMYHCPVCSCMVLAGIAHGPCIDEECPYYDLEADRRFQASLEADSAETE